MIRPEQLPYQNPMAQTYDSGKFESVMDQGLALADWDGFEQRLAQSQDRGRLRGIGIATFLEWTGGNVFEERVTVRVAADGFIEIVSATQAMGQGIVTSYAQLAVTSSACRSKRSGSCRATPTSPMASAAPAPGRSSPAARRSRSLRSARSRKRRRWPPRNWK
jgi:hypothetical protein